MHRGWGDPHDFFLNFPKFGRLPDGGGSQSGEIHIHTSIRGGLISVGFLEIRRFPKGGYNIAE